MIEEFGRVGSAETGSHASHEAPAGLRPTGFDPARDVVQWARETQREAADGKRDLRDLGKAMDGRWDQDLPAAALSMLATAQDRDGATRALATAMLGLSGLRGLIKETSEPHRVMWEGVWHYGPLADAYLATIREIADGADRVLAQVANVIDVPRDSDGSPEGGDVEGGSVRSTTARPEGIAQ